MTREDFLRVLAELKFAASPNARNIPKGAFKKLRKRFPDAFTPSLTTTTDQGAEAADNPRNPDKFPPPADEIIGTRTDVTYITTEEVLDIHRTLEIEFRDSSDPISPPGIKDFGSLDSAVNRPILARDKYPTVEMATAALLHSLIKNHAFYNGNKRTGIVAMLVSLDKNGRKLVASEGSLFTFAYEVAASELLNNPRDRYEQPADHEVLAIARWVKDNSRPAAVDSKVRNISWPDLRDILKKYDCEFKNMGSKIEITRNDPMAKSIFGIPFRQKILKASLSNPNASHEIDKAGIQLIRQKLKLDANYVSNGDFSTQREVARPDSFWNIREF